MLDVHEHLRVDRVQGREKAGPVACVVALAQGHEIPGSIFGPLVHPLVATEDGVGLVGGEPAKTFVHYTVDGRVLDVDAHILRGGLQDERARVLDHGHRIHLLAE